MVEENWERKTLEQLARDGLVEQRRKRRWSIFFRLLMLALITLVLVGGWWSGQAKVCLDQCTALVEMRGVLDGEGQSSAENINAGLQAAFKHKGTRGVVLRINSPGGSPVQAGQINDEIKRLRGKYPDTPLYAVVEEICASGGYYVAVAADQIYVDKASIVGSIGVIMDGFGFEGAMNKLGVERRVFTAGENKAFLDPFSPLVPVQREYAQRLLDEVHQQFVDTVRQGRGTRLKESPELFSGLVWNGKRSVELGLTDGLGSVESVAREIIKAEEIVDFTLHDNLAERVARKFGATLARGGLAALSQWSWR